MHLASVESGAEFAGDRRNRIHGPGAADFAVGVWLQLRCGFLRVKVPNDNCTLWFTIKYISKSMLYVAVGAERVYMRGLGKSEGTIRRPVRFLLMSAPFVDPYLSESQQINGRYMFPELPNGICTRKLSIFVGDHNTIQPGRSGVLPVGSKACQLLHKLFSDHTIPKFKSFQRGWG